MGRVIQTEGVGKRRQHLLRLIGTALRRLMVQTSPNEHTLDLAAFIALALRDVVATVEEATRAWEKRDYWVKADRFRMEWNWAENLGKALEKAVVAKDWDEIARLAGKIFMHVGNVKIPKRFKAGEPWKGAYRNLLERFGKDEHSGERED